MKPVFFFVITISFVGIIMLSACEDTGADSSTADSQLATRPPEAAPGPAPQPGSDLQPPYPLQDSSQIFTVDEVQIYLVEKGNGPKPAPGSNVVMNYRGTLLDGSEFDSSFDKPGYQDFSLNGLIEGWKIALPQVPTGSKVKLIIPPEKGYGSAARPGIPANSTLVFDIELASTY